MKVIIASNNDGKILEFKRLLRPLGYEVLSQYEAGVLSEPDETGSTFEENARIKAQDVFKHIAGLSERVLVIADDSGLEVDFLNGEPGVYSARYAAMQTPPTSMSGNELILQKLWGLPLKQRTARFVCCICYAEGVPGETSAVDVAANSKVVQGVCEGYIGFEERGEGGFGYDPIFMVGNRSFAELTIDEKNAVSHRGIALGKLVEELK